MTSIQRQLRVLGSVLGLPLALMASASSGACATTHETHDPLSDSALYGLYSAPVRSVAQPQPVPPVQAAPLYVLVPIPNPQPQPQRAVIMAPPPAPSAVVSERPVLAPYTPTDSPLLRPGAVY
jgi:hypothetical protein